MKFEIFFDIIILFFLFILNFIIENNNYYFLILYIFINIYQIYILFLIIIYSLQKKNQILLFIFISIILNVFTYYIICDPNPIICFIIYYCFFPNFFKAILIVLVHTYFLSIFQINENLYNCEKFSIKDTKFKIFYGINNFIEQMKKLISYIGEKNVIISIVENGDSRDKTRKYLKSFQIYLDKKKIINKIILKHEVDDPRKKKLYFKKYGPLRIQFYAILRNKCFELLYSLNNLNFNNTKIIFFNDIYFKYEDIINLISTNQEDYDAVCGMDFLSGFYDRWVSIDLDGNSLLKYFPFFINKEAQDLIINHKPVRVFSCWNGVTIFTASPLKNKNIQFRYKKSNKILKYKINNCQKVDYESECTYLHIDFFNLGYTKKYINPNVRVTYKYKYYYRRKYF